jgi:hypothetical protein
MAQQFPPELLAQAPDQSSCICANCLARFQQHTTSVQQFTPA